MKLTTVKYTPSSCVSLQLELDKFLAPNENQDSLGEQYESTDRNSDSFSVDYYIDCISTGD